MRSYLARKVEALEFAHGGAGPLLDQSEIDAGVSRYEAALGKLSAECIAGCPDAAWYKHTIESCRVPFDQRVLGWMGPVDFAL